MRVNEILEQPYRNGAVWARQRIRQFRGDVVVVLQAGCGQAFGALLSEIRDPSEAILIAEEELDLRMLELEEGLDYAGIDALEPGDAESLGGVADSADSDLSIEEAEERIRALPDSEGRFVLTERCIQRLRPELATNPRELAAQATRLRALALRWSQSVSTGGLGDDVVAVARTEHDLVLARSDDPMRRAKLDKFDHEGRQYSRETHVKVTDHTSLRYVARIYFAFDSASQPPRVIVDHIGSKLSPYVKR